MDNTSNPATQQKLEERKRVINYSDLFVGDLWRYFLRAIWLFFPPILIFFFGYMCFWKLSQGRGVMIITLENRKVFGLFLLALLFWVMMLGAYGIQTSVNDYRLQKYITTLNNEEPGGEHYKHMSLYKPKDSMSYTMNWVISKYVLTAMDKRLETHPELDSLLVQFKANLNLRNTIYERGIICINMHCSCFMQWS